MPDKTYDAVIIGGGVSGLPAAIYLAKYGGMKVAVFERRHELGGGLSSAETAAPGFVGDHHCSDTGTTYFLPVEHDFPDFLEKGGQQFYHKASAGVITREDQKCWLVYNLAEDPRQEKTAREIARFAGDKDAETYLKLWDYAVKTDFERVANENALNLPPPVGQPTPLDRWFEEYLRQPDCPVDAEWAILPPVIGTQQLFDNFGVSLMWLRRALASGTVPMVPLGGLEYLFWILVQPGLGKVVGGTHSAAHAYARILLENGGEFYTHSHVDRIIVEDGAAKGIRLRDGTEIGARHVVLSTLSPAQLCFQLLNGEYLSQRILNKVKHLRGGLTTISWATWAHREPVNFRASAFNTDINRTQSVTLGSYDPEPWYREYYLRYLGNIPPLKDLIVHHSYTGVDRSRVMGETGHTTLTESPLPIASFLTEQQWLEYKKTYAEDVVKEWQVFTTNMTWDNIIGYDAIMPWDVAGRLVNMADGDWSVVDIPAWRPMSMRPITEFAQHRVPGIKRLYATGAPWLHGAGKADLGYRVYKAIAEDLGLRKPWAEKGRTW